MDAFAAGKSCATLATLSYYVLNKGIFQPQFCFHPNENKSSNVLLVLVTPAPPSLPQGALGYIRQYKDCISHNVFSTRTVHWLLLRRFGGGRGFGSHALPDISSLFDMGKN